MCKVGSTGQNQVGRIGNSGSQISSNTHTSPDINRAPGSSNGIRSDSGSFSSAMTPTGNGTGGPSSSSDSDVSLSSVLPKIIARREYNLQNPGNTQSSSSTSSFRSSSNSSSEVSISMEPSTDHGNANSNVSSTSGDDGFQIISSSGSQSTTSVTGYSSVGGFSSIETDESNSIFFSDDTTPPDHQGSGGCCACWDKTAHSLKAGLVQAASTALTFGVKPLVEEAVKAALLETPLDPGTADVISRIVGGVFVGAIHTGVGTVVSGVLNSALSMTTYKPVENQFGNELLTIDAPVMAAFVAGYALQGGLVAHLGLDDGVVKALSKTITSTVAGFVQGALTDGLRQTVAKDGYEPVQAPEFSKEIFAENLDKAIRNNFGSKEKLGHNFIGKIVGSAVGNLTAPLWGGLDLGGMATGAMGMTTYLTGWFGGIHAFSAVLGLCEAQDDMELSLETVSIDYSDVTSESEYSV
ncbi:hypothetical protein WNZ15_19580 [Roseibium sp. AS2]|uniref:hypothetical protein n=1 Tax=Roseibium sp. AS2 TaxID=3135781 RepID=UPI003177C239